MTQRADRSTSAATAESKTPPGEGPGGEVERLFASQLTIAARRTDRMFGALMLLQWIAAILFAAYLSPYTWTGKVQSVHVHVYASVVLGGAITSLPLVLILFRPGRFSTRLVVACAQMLWSALLIHVTGGRIETHFHVFGSLAFLAFYRDARILIPATLVVAADHFVRGFYWPQSVYGVANPEWWRFLEHAAWVLFIDVFLLLDIHRARRVLRALCTRQVALAAASRELELARDELEHRVEERTAQLADAKRLVELKVEELRATQSDLVDASRRAGMAEVASAVLHNVGNVLTSVIAGTELARGGVARCPVERVAAVADLLEANRPRLGPFFQDDPQGASVLPYLRRLGQDLTERRSEILSDLNEVEAHVAHLAAIVRAQRVHSSGEVFLESCRLDAVVGHAVRIAAPFAELVAHVEHVGESAAEVWVDRNRLVSVLVNLLRNAAEAVAARGPGVGRIEIRSSVEGEVFRVAVTDNGEGIPPEDLPLIFSFGFTTKVQGHGIGLHDAANAARAMGGQLRVSSPGSGRGATFTLELPVDPVVRGLVSGPPAAPAAADCA